MSDSTTKFDARGYWESRLSEKYSLAGVGDIRMPLSYNNVLYAIRKAAFRKALKSILPDSPESVLDVGSGSGFYIDQWSHSAKNVNGCDITDTAVSQLRNKHPDCSFERWDAGDSEIPFKTTYDAVSAFDVFFHIVDNERYHRAIANVGRLINDGGYFLYSDYFMPEVEKRQEHIVFRTRENINAVMSENGFAEVKRIPVFYMMNAPVVTKKLVPRVAFRLMLRFGGRSELFGSLVGWSAYPIERLMTAMQKEATGTELVVYQKTPSKTGT